MTLPFRKVKFSTPKICPLTLILLEVFFLGVFGGGVAHFLQPVFGFYYDLKYAIISYSSIIYGFMGIGIFSHIFSLRKRILSYIGKECVVPSRSILLFTWCFTFSLTLFCFAWIFIQGDMKHALFSSLDATDYFQVGAIRHNITKSIDLRIYNFGLLYALPINIIISYVLVKKYLLFFASTLLLIIFGTFTLAKAPIIYVLIFLFFYRILINPLYLRKSLNLLFIAIFLVLLLFIATKYTMFNLRSIYDTVGKRILYGQTMDLPFYFEVFSRQKIGIRSLLPPYIVNQEKTASKIIAEYSIEKQYSYIC